MGCHGCTVPSHDDQRPYRDRSIGQSTRFHVTARTTWTQDQEGHEYSAELVRARGTRVAAQCMGLDGEIGTLEKGKRADLIAIEGNPLEDIRVLQSSQCVRLVMKDGIVVLDRVSRGDSVSSASIVPHS